MDWRGATGDNFIKIPINRHIEPIAANSPGEGARNHKALKRKNGALFGIYPKQLCVHSAFGHGKQAQRIGPQNVMGGDDPQPSLRHDLTLGTAFCPI
jgi:hypothetical protein